MITDANYFDLLNAFKLDDLLLANPEDHILELAIVQASSIEKLKIVY